MGLWDVLMTAPHQRLYPESLGFFPCAIAVHIGFFLIHSNDTVFTIPPIVMLLLNIRDLFIFFLIPQP